MDLSLYDPHEVLGFMEEQIERYARVAKKRRRKNPYISCLLIDGNEITARVIDGHDGDQNRSSLNDVLVTVQYQGGGVGRAIAFTPSPRQLHHAIAAAEREAFQGFKEGRGVSFMHPDKRNYSCHKKLNLDSFATLTYSDIADRLAEIEQAIAEVPGIIGSQALFELNAGREIFADSRGRRTIQDFAWSYFYLLADAQARDMPDGIFELEQFVGAAGCAGELDALFSKAKQEAASLGERTVRFATAGPKVGGFKLGPRRYDVVIDGAMAGVTMHELGAGHLAEASWFLKGKSTGHPFFLSQKVGIPELNIIDDPRTRFKGVKPISYYQIDHEGVVCGRTYLVKGGKFHSYLTSRESAGTLRSDQIRKVLTGNGRIGRVAKEDDETYSPVEPESRMSTLSILPVPGGPDLQGLLERVKGRGLYITVSKSKGEVHNDTAKGKVLVQEVYFVTKDLDLIPVRMPNHQLYIVDNVVSYMGKIKEIGNASTVIFESSRCESDSGVIFQSCGGAAVYAEGVSILPVVYRDSFQGPLVPVPSRRKR